jgi:hypothetical protein
MVDASSMSFKVCRCSSNYGGSIHPHVFNAYECICVVCIWIVLFLIKMVMCVCTPSV